MSEMPFSRMGRMLLAAILNFVLVSGVWAQEAPHPPIATKIAKVDTIHGEIVTDDYAWMRDRTDPDVLDYLDAENDYTEAMMQDTKGLQEKLFSELVARIKEADLSAPEQIDQFTYYSRTEQGKNYPIYCRKSGRMAPEEVVLDQNQLAENYSYCALGGYQISPDHNLLAFSVDTTGSEVYTLMIKDLRTGQYLPDRVDNVGTSIAWANDNVTIFYDVVDETFRPYRIFRHRLGTPATADVMVFDEPDEHFFVSTKHTRDKKTLLIELGSISTTEVWYLDADNPDGEFKVIEPRSPGVEYYVSNHLDRLFIMTNDGAPNFKVMEAPLANPAKANWKEFLPQDPAVKIDAIMAFRDHLVVRTRQDGLQQFQIFYLPDKTSHFIKFDDATYAIKKTDNPEFYTDIVRFSYQSLITPKTVYDYNMVTKQREVVKETDVLGGFNAADYGQERVWAKAPDGVQVPVILCYRKDRFRKDGTNPLVLYAYGAYGDPMDPWFSTNRISLLDRGFVFAVAQVRGGGEMGRQWYFDGKLLKKKNTFTDFIACAEHLIANGYCAKDKVIANGGSAGGLTVGAITHMRPDLWKAVIADVPFVDVINTMLDPTIPLTVTEWEEWGDPRKPDHYQYMKSYSPYDNVTAKDYPNLLINTSFYDPRVGYWEPTKWCAKLRANKTDKNLLLFKIDMESGHGGASGRYDQYHEIAFEYAFMLKVLGMNLDN